VLVGGLFSACSNPGRSNGDADPTSTSHSGSSRLRRPGGDDSSVRSPSARCWWDRYRARVSAVSLCSVSYKISGAEPYALNDLSTMESILLGAAQTAGLTICDSDRMMTALSPWGSKRW